MAEIYGVKESEANLNKTFFLVFANIIGFTSNCPYSKDGWEYIPGSMKFFIKFPIDSTRSEWINSIENLNYILLALFISDANPRRIHSFDTPRDLSFNIATQLCYIFGEPQEKPVTPTELRNILSCVPKRLLQDSKTFNGINTSLVDEWYDLFKKNSKIATSIRLLNESYYIVNRTIFQMAFYDPVELSIAIVLLVSALETLFTSRYDNPPTEFSFRFGLIGSLYYEKYVTNDFIEMVAVEFYSLVTTKIPREDFQKLLIKLYGMRSTIAHGSNNELTESNKNLKAILEILKLGNIFKSDKSDFLKSVAVILNTIQHHIFTLIYQSKNELLEGHEIIKSIKI